MTADEVAETLAKIDVGHFDPRFRMRVDRYEDTFAAVCCLDNTVDANGVRENDGYPVAISHIFVRSEYERLRPELVAEEVRKTILRLYEHELDEWFRYEGKRIRDPHAEEV